MRNLLLIVTILICSILKTEAQSYTVGILTNHYYKVKMNIQVEGTDIYLYTTMTTEKMSYDLPPSLKIRTFDDIVIELNGVNINSKKSGAGVLVGGIMVPITEYSEIARFNITEEDMNAISKGIKKIRLGTSPSSYDKTFSADNLGKKLYKQYLKAQKQRDSF